MLARIRRRCGEDNGNGPAHAFITHVRNDAGFNATRTIDAMSMSLWPSRGLRLTAYEVKCSRSDWLAELKNPAKAEAFAPYVDHFYLVVADAKMVQPGELPETWGLLAPHGKGLKVVTPAPLLPDPKPIDRGMLAALLRQAGVQANVAPEEVREAERRGFAEGVESGKAQSAYSLRRAEDFEARHRKRDLEIAEIIGSDLMSVLRGRPESFAKAVKTALDAERDMDHLRSRLERLGNDAQVIGEQAARILREHGMAIEEAT